MSDYPFQLGVTGNSFPLSGNPYWSRVTLSQLQQQPAKNYFLLAFKPGLPLQASELNEFQEIQMMENTLFSTMVSSWPVYLSGHTGSDPIYGPGWKGTTPLYPEFDRDFTTKNMVGYTGASGDLFIRKGWYLVNVKSSNLKHWVYLTQEYFVTGPSEPFPAFLGFTASYEIVKPAQDPSLYDNSSGTTIIAGAAAGADRIKIKLSNPFWTTDKNLENFSPMAKKLDTDDKILYMNNVPVPEIN
jgi:hypothetical protein